MSNGTESATATEQLIDKLKAKMDLAKFFAGFISLFLGIAFRDLSSLVADSTPLISYSVRIGFLFTLAALAFSIAALFAYDRLLMPREFWKEKDDSFNRTLYDEMRKAWKCLFRPAVFTFFVGLLGFLVAVLRSPIPAVILWLIPIVAASLVYFFYSKIEGKIFE